MKLFWYGPKPPVPSTVFHASLQVLYKDAHEKRPTAAGFLMLLHATLYAADFPENFHLSGHLYDIHVIPLDTELLTDLIGPIQHVQANRENFEFFIL